MKILIILLFTSSFCYSQYGAITFSAQNDSVKVMTEFIQSENGWVEGRSISTLLPYYNIIEVSNSGKNIAFVKDGCFVIKDSLQFINTLQWSLAKVSTQLAEKNAKMRALEDIANCIKDGRVTNIRNFVYAIKKYQELTIETSK